MIMASFIISVVAVIEDEQASNSIPASKLSAILKSLKSTYPTVPAIAPFLPFLKEVNVLYSAVIAALLTESMS